MPQFIPIIVAAAAQAAGAAALTQALLVIGSTLLGNAYQARRAKKKARAQADAALRASLQDRLINFPAQNAPHRFVYGQDVRVGGDVYPVGTSGTDQNVFHFLVLLAAREITAIKRVWIGDKELLFDPVTGEANGAPFFKTSSAPVMHQASSSGAGQVTLPSTPIAGTLSVVNANPENQQELTGWTVLGAVVSGLPPSIVLNFNYLGDTSAPFVNVQRYLGTVTQAAPPELVAAFGSSWPSTSQLKGRAYVYLRIKYDPDLFESGVESVTALVDGHQVFDPRSGVNVISTNPALCIRDVFTHPLLGNFSAAKLDDVDVIAAANACDEQVPIATTPSLIFERRYTCGGVFDSTESGKDVIESLADSMAGWVNFKQGRLTMRAGVSQAASLSLGENHALPKEGISIGTSVPRASLFNSVSGLFQDPARNWQVLPFSPYKNATYATQDGGVIDLDVGEYRWSRTNFACQRLAKVLLERSRQAITCQMWFNFTAYKLTPGDTFNFTWSDQGWSSKLFRVIERTFDTSKGIGLTFVEDAPGVYNWNLGEQTTYDLAPNTNLPDPFTVPKPSGLTLSSGDAALLKLGDGTIVERLRVQWTLPTDVDVLNGGFAEVYLRRADVPLNLNKPFGEPQAKVLGSDADVFLQGVQDGVVYVVLVRFRTNTGRAGDWQIGSHKVIGKSNPPPAPTSLTVNVLPDGARRYSMTMPDVLPLDIAGARVAFNPGATALPKNSQTLVRTEIVTVRAEQGGAVITFDHPGPSAGVNSFRAWLVDTSGNSSATEAVAANVTLGAPPASYRNARNYVRNGGFELGFSDWQKESYNGANDSNITIAQEPGVPVKRGLNVACFIIPAGSPANAEWRVNQILSAAKNNNLEPNKSYLISAWIGSDFVSGRHLARVMVTHDSGAGEVVLATKDWDFVSEYIELAVTMPAAFSSARVRAIALSVAPNSLAKAAVFDDYMCELIPEGVALSDARRSEYQDAIPGPKDVDTPQLLPGGVTAPQELEIPNDTILYSDNSGGVSLRRIHVMGRLSYVNTLNRVVRVRYSILGVFQTEVGLSSAGGGGALITYELSVVPSSGSGLTRPQLTVANTQTDVVAGGKSLQVQQQGPYLEFLLQPNLTVDCEFRVRLFQGWDGVGTPSYVRFTNTGCKTQMTVTFA